MRITELFLVVALSLLFTGCTQIIPLSKGESPPPEYPVEYFFRNSEVSDYQISPMGNYISMVKPWNDRKNVFIHPVGEPEKTKQVTSIRDRDILYYYWVNDDTIIYSRDTDGDENLYLVIVNITTGKERPITPTSGVRANVINILENQPNNILVSTNERNPNIFDVYSLNLKTGKRSLIEKNPGNIRNWFTDHEGNIRLISTSDGVNTSLFYRNNVNSKFRLLKELSFKEKFTPISFTPDNKNLYVTSRVTRDKAAIIEYNLQKNKEVREIFSHSDVDVTSAYYSNHLNKLVMIPYVTDKKEFFFLDKGYQKTFSRLKKKLPNIEIDMTSMTRDENQMIIVAHSDTSRPSYYLYDRSTNKLLKLADNAPWHKPEDMAKMESITYIARDGLEIHGYLTLPKGRKANNLPLIVLPHGGPWARDYWGFQPEVQLFANRGIAVLQMNFRGSTGYGRRFWEKSFKQWGQSMQDDITDGVSWAIEQGYAQQGQSCIYGASYGGYAALAGLTFTPNLYKCGIDYVGVSNLFTFIDSIPPYWTPFLDMLHEQIGNPNLPEDAKKMEAYSPVFHVEQIKAPLLVLQGAKDPRVNKNESDQIVDALRKRNVTVEYIVKDNEGHGFQSLENRLDGYKAMDRFIKTHLLERSQ